MTRLTHAVVERQIQEMWVALAEGPFGREDEGYSQACDQAADTEARLRNDLAYQDRLDEAAPELLEALRDVLTAYVPVTAEGYSDIGGCVRRARAAIAKVEGGAAR